ncbi:outer membrane beta-barrel protein [Indioceanicola profundi]|uniref:outer membrane beta-barrel protein n=1 Tax=Indioceanicola profundi TaxID=2220096 RepID=UPI000E6A9FE3|nr:outer membrane beta-barrel protein [Indioceanicola profundi]
MKRTMVAAIALLAGMNAAHAQDVRGIPVTERARPDFDALGIRAGAFLVKPSLTLTGAYDDNIFAEDEETVDDLVAVFLPSLIVQSDWNSHYLRLRSAAEIGRHADFTSEDYEDFNIGADSRLDITRGDSINSTLEYRREHDERGSPNDVGGREPTEYDLVYGLLGYSRTGRRVTLRVQGSFNDYDFKDVPGVGTTIVDQDFRDRIEYNVASRVGYEFRPDTSIFVQGALNWREYDNNVRNSDGYRLDAGFSFDLGGVTTGELFAGYRQQKYDNPLFQNEDGFTYGGNILWNPTSLTSVQFRLINEVNESTETGASAYISSGASIQVDHELLRNVLIGGLVGYTENDYRGIERMEDVWNLGATADYLLNRNLRVGVGYRYITRDSTTANEDYTRNVVTLSLRGSF